MKIPARANSIIPGTPDITFVKYKTNSSDAITNLIVMSMIPIFFFIVSRFWLKSVLQR